MAFTLSRNLRLRLDDSLSANSRYNLERLDLLGSTFTVDTTDTTNIRSVESIVLEPNSADVGGSGTGGSVSLGSADHVLEAVSIHADEFLLSAPLGLADQASGGNKSLFLKYKSDANGSLDTSADRSLLIDVEGSDRTLVLGGNLSTSGGNLVLTLSGNSSVNLPVSGTLATLAGTETLSNKSFSDYLRVLGGGFRSQFSVGAQSGNLDYVLPTAAPTSNQVLRANSASPQQLEWATIAGGGGLVEPFEANWVTGDGLTKLVTHNLGSSDVDVTVIDQADNQIVSVDSIVITNSNSITLTASEAPGSTWRVVIQANS